VDPLLIVAAAIVAFVAVGRAARLLTHDDWPPAARVRAWWINKTEVRGGWRAEWSGLFTCPFCMAPYLALGDLTWVVLAGVEPDGFWSNAWWFVNGWAALSYAAAILVAYDEPPE
jgi:hypothetical protein